MVSGCSVVNTDWGLMGKLQRSATLASVQHLNAFCECGTCTNGDTPTPLPTKEICEAKVLYHATCRCHWSGAWNRPYGPGPASGPCGTRVTAHALPLQSWDVFSSTDATAATAY